MQDMLRVILKNRLYNEELKMKCCICKKDKDEYGNNPFPIAGQVCCDECNAKVIIPLRIFMNNLDKKNVALLIKEDSLEIIRPKNKYFTLAEKQKCVGGYIEISCSPLPEYIVIFNEEGQLKNMFWNDLAHLLFEHELVGNVLVCPVRIFEKPEED